uniref:Uncharacterized protein n=1 Tax=Timema genevievae TaxID=629358 RepID=A0A7R9JW81_TIMGE|nr:unnamed protein product [Timema genevievae]
MKEVKPLVWWVTLKKNTHHVTLSLAHQLVQWLHWLGLNDFYPPSEVKEVVWQSDKSVPGPRIDPRTPSTEVRHLTPRPPGLFINGGKGIPFPVGSKASTFDFSEYNTVTAISPGVDLYHLSQRPEYPSLTFIFHQNNFIDSNFLRSSNFDGR